MSKVSVLGAGLAGCEAAYQLANCGIHVDLYEMKPKQYTPAHSYAGFAELVCSNSLKADRIESAGGMLKAEMRILGSLTLECADQCRVAAGGALAVDREQFSDLVTEKIRSHPNIRVIEAEATDIPGGDAVIIATGPLTTQPLADAIVKMTGSDKLSFYDAAAPIVTADSVDMDKAFFAARYGRGDDDYINCPMNKEEYEQFYEALVQAESVELKQFEKEGLKVYEGCMPIEVMAKRGPDTIRFGPLKPVGLTDPRTGRRPWAVLQLRKENADGTLYNLVGFQTNLKFGEQKRVFSMITGLENADFIRYGVMHRNTFIDSPRLLNRGFQLRKNASIFFAGQITGVEGYMESASSGIIAGINAARMLAGKNSMDLPRETMTGALTKYISDESVVNFQPMGANMGILPAIEPRIRDKKERYLQIAQRGLEQLRTYIHSID